VPELTGSQSQHSATYGRPREDCDCILPAAAIELEPPASDRLITGLVSPQALTKNPTKSLHRISQFLHPAPWMYDAPFLLKESKTVAAAGGLVVHATGWAARIMTKQDRPDRS
jgi:hypothetical protein